MRSCSKTIHLRMRQFCYHDDNMAANFVWLFLRWTGVGKMFETIAFCRVHSSYLLLNQGIRTVTVWIFVSSWQDLFSTRYGMKPSPTFTWYDKYFHVILLRMANRAIWLVVSFSELANSAEPRNCLKLSRLSLAQGAWQDGDKTRLYLPHCWGWKLFCKLLYSLA